MYGCGIGPVNGQKDYEKTAGVLNECVDLITLREPNSGELLKSMGVTEPEIRLAADPVLSIRPSDDIYVKKFFAQHGMDENGRYLCIGLRPWNGLDGKLNAIAEALRESCEKYQLSPVFLPMNRELDMGIAEQMAALIGLPHTILPQIDDIPLMSGILKRMQLTVSMRLHAIVLSASVGVPTVGISYDPKVSSFVEYTRCGSCIELEELTKQRLFDDIAKVLENESGEEREAHIRASRERESINMEMAARYMNLEEKQ